MAKVNAYLAKKTAEETAKNKRLIAAAIYRDSSIWMVMLNREFGFGKDRLDKCRTKVKELYDYYADASQTDYVYGDEVIDREIRKIWGEE